MRTEKPWQSQTVNKIPVLPVLPENTIKTGKHKKRTPEEQRRRSQRRTELRRQTTGVVGNVPYMRNSRVHVALLYMKMVHDKVTYNELCEFSPIFKLTRGSRHAFTGEMKKMEQRGHVAIQPLPTGALYRITQTGIIHLYATARHYAESHPLEDAEDDLSLSDQDENTKSSVGSHQI